MAEVKVKCPYCRSEEISLYGKNAKGKQRYLCNNKQCKRKTFILDYTYNACKPQVKETAFKKNLHKLNVLFACANLLMVKRGQLKSMKLPTRG